MQRMGYFWALDGQFRRHKALVNRIHILAAIKRYYLIHHVWPDSLDQLKIDDAYMLIDPINEQPFVYEKTDNSFRLYSLGLNGIDDDGIKKPANGKDDNLIWPQGITEEEDEDNDVEKSIK